MREYESSDIQMKTYLWPKKNPLRQKSDISSQCSNIYGFCLCLSRVDILYDWIIGLNHKERKTRWSEQVLIKCVEQQSWGGQGDKLLSCWWKEWWTYVDEPKDCKILSGIQKLKASVLFHFQIAIVKQRELTFWYVST